MQSFSQASQDLFVLYMSQFKRNGTFLEIGSNHPSKHNNTYLLESQYDWKGIMVEINTTFEIMYKIQRPKSLYYIGDSTKAPYFEMLTSNGFPKNIDYLQVDVDVNTGSTIETLIHLNSTVFDEYKFGIVTFEHDIYSGDFFDTRRRSREIFEKRGYVLLFPDVSVDWTGKLCAFEDWYIHPEIIPRGIFEHVHTENSLSNTKIIEILHTYMM